MPTYKGRRTPSPSTDCRCLPTQVVWQGVDATWIGTEWWVGSCIYDKKRGDFHKSRMGYFSGRWWLVHKQVLARKGSFTLVFLHGIAWGYLMIEKNFRQLSWTFPLRRHTWRAPTRCNDTKGSCVSFRSRSRRGRECVVRRNEARKEVSFCNKSVFFYYKVHGCDCFSWPWRLR